MLAYYTKHLEPPHDDCPANHEQLSAFWLMATGQTTSLNKLSLAQQWALLVRIYIDQKNTKRLLRKPSGYKLLWKLSSGGTLPVMV
jgi:hypothetical protein